MPCSTAVFSFILFPSRRKDEGFYKKREKLSCSTEGKKKKKKVKPAASGDGLIKSFSDYIYH